MAQSLNKPFPKWLRKALKAGALTHQEAQMFHCLHLLATQSEPATAPKWLHPACDKLYLLELPAHRARH